MSPSWTLRTRYPKITPALFYQDNNQVIENVGEQSEADNEAENLNHS